MQKTSPELNDEEIDDIVRILDKNAKGNTKVDIAVARAMIPQGAWRRLFRELRQNNDLKEVINNILNEKDQDRLIEEIDRLYRINESKNNYLTGKSANAIDILLFVYNPLRFISVISLNDRQRIVEYFGFEGLNFEEDPQGKKVVLSNQIILDNFKKILVRGFSPRVLSNFLYLKLKDYWKRSPEENEDEIEETEISEEVVGQFEERIYQKLIHRNFKLIFPDLDYYDSESQNDKEGHYTTEAGIMDFLCKDSEGNFVVIELKKEARDKTIGQICRYMGWVKENLCTEKQKVKGVIISEKNDPDIRYAIQIAQDIVFKRMKLDVKIDKW